VAYRRPTPKRSTWNTVAKSEEDEELERTFTATLTGELEDTVRNLRVLGEPRAEQTHEGRAGSMRAIIMLTDELRDQREKQFLFLASLGKKASSNAVAESLEKMSKELNERVATIRNIAMWAIGIQFALIGFLLTRVH